MYELPSLGKPRVRTKNFGDQVMATRVRQYYTLGGIPASRVEYPGAVIDLGWEYCADELHRGPPYKTGGPLSHQRYEETVPAHPYSGVGDGFHEDSGECYVDWSPDWSPLAVAGSVYPAAIFGATGFKRCRPGRPVMDLGVSLGELKDMPRMLKQARDAAQKLASGGNPGLGDAADTYLGVKFGWEPIARDIKDALSVQVALSEALEQLRRDNGKGVRRRCTLRRVETSAKTTLSGFPAAGKIKGVDSLNDVVYPLYVTKTDTETDTVWFSARWRYWIPDIDTPEGERSLIRRLLGLEITPDVAWNLIPWSWLSDWFTNFGHAVANIRQPVLPDLAAEYAYVMRERRRTRTVSSSFALQLRAGGVTHVTARSEYDFLEQYRVRASPYGFGVRWPELSLAQLAILTALGISRSS